MSSARSGPDPVFWRVVPLDEGPPEAALEPQPEEPVRSPTRRERREAERFGGSYRWKLLAVIGLAVLGFGSLMTLVTAALGTIAADLETTEASAAWVLTGLMLSMAVGTPAGGKLADAYGHRGMFLLGLVGMTSTMILTFWVWNIGVFIVLRVLFGISGALLMPSGMALLMHAFGPAERARAVGWFQFAMTGAPTLGVIAGGPLLDAIGWRAIFVVFGLIAAGATVAAFVLVKPIPRGERVAIDWLGAALLAGATLLVLLAITRIPALSRRGESIIADPTILTMLASSAVLYLVFVMWEQRATVPLLDMRLFRKRTFSLPLVSAACNQFAYMGAFVIVPGVLQGPFGYSVGVAALLMVPRPGVFAVASPLGGSLVTRIGARWPMIFATTAMIGSMAAFAFGTSPGDFGLGLVMIGLVLSGASAGIGSPAYQTLVANSVDDRDLGVANGMNQTVMWIGIILGIQSMVAFAGEDPSEARLKATFAFGAAVAAFGYLAPLFATPRRAASVATTAP